MTVVMQQIKQTIMDRCHLRMVKRLYAVAADRIGFELDDLKIK